MNDEYNFKIDDNGDTVELGIWFLELKELGKMLSLYEKENFFYAISLPSLKLSSVAISLGLVEGKLENEVEKTHLDVNSIRENSKIVYWDGKKLCNAKFICIEQNYCGLGEDYARVQLENNLFDFMKINGDPKKRILFENQDNSSGNSFEKIKSYESGLGEIILNNESNLKLRTSTESKLLFVTNKKEFESQICNSFVMHKNNFYEFNDILRVQDFLGRGQSIFSSITSHQAPSSKILNENSINFKVYIGSSSYLKKQSSYSNINNTIVFLSPSESQYEDAIHYINKRYNERNYRSDFDVGEIKKMQLPYPSIFFKEC